MRNVELLMPAGNLEKLKYPIKSTVTCDNQAFEGCTALKRIELYGCWVAE